MESIGWLFCGLIAGVSGCYFGMKYWNENHSKRTGGRVPISELVKNHFQPLPTDDISISERQFPFRVRADLQRTIDKLFGSETKVLHFCGVRNEYSHGTVTLSDCIVESQHNPAVSIPPEYEELDIGEELPIRVLKNGLWLLEKTEVHFAVLLAPTGRYGEITGMQFQVGIPNSPAGTAITQDFFRHLEASILRADSYRGKILSLEQPEHRYSGKSTGISVHKLRTVDRDEVILPQSTLTLLERNVIDFVKHRDKLTKFKQATKKGLLFYGPPGTGKTHTIHYLAKALHGHTMLLISAEQVGLLSELHDTCQTSSAEHCRHGRR